MTTPHIESTQGTQTGKKTLHADQVIDYISQLLGELSEMASEIERTELADLIRFCGRAAQMEKVKFEAKPQN